LSDDNTDLDDGIQYMNYFLMVHRQIPEIVPAKWQVAGV